MSQDLREMEWLYHVDLDVTRHLTKADIMNSAGLAWDNIHFNQKPEPGDIMVIAVVRPSQKQ